MQPTVSAQIKQLTDTVVQPLFEQVGKRFYLIDAGKESQQTCHELFDTWERVEMRVSDLKGVIEGRLPLAMATIAKYFVPRMLGPFNMCYPRVNLPDQIVNRERCTLPDAAPAGTRPGANSRSHIRRRQQFGGSALSHMRKSIVARPGPKLFDAVTAMPVDHAYPSARSAQITAFADALYLLLRSRDVLVRPWLPAMLLAALSLVGASRVYLQLHFPSNVEAGIVTSALWVAGLAALLLRQRSA